MNRIIEEMYICGDCQKVEHMITVEQLQPTDTDSGDIYKYITPVPITCSCGWVITEQELNEFGFADAAIGQLWLIEQGILK